MIKISQLKLPIDYTEEMLKKKISRILKIKEQELWNITLLKRSIDARKKPEIFYSMTVLVETKKEEAVIKRAGNHQVTLAKEEIYQFPPSGERELQTRPVIIGSGPAGLFCAYFLAKHGYCLLVLERGEDVDSRKRTVEEFWESGRFKPSSNVQFGEGGAGTFSDGKLNTLVKDKDGRSREVLSVFVKNGAPEKILYDGKPHIGTDILISVVKNMRKTIEELGGEVRFGHQVVDFHVKEGRLTSLLVRENDGTVYELETEVAVLAIGHSARDTFAVLEQKKIPMEAKAFAVGLRVEHPQKLIDDTQYGNYEALSESEKKVHDLLPAAAYKLTAKTSYGRGVYSFCMCPGGFVVNASSEEQRLVVNGMSYSKRDGENANSAIIVAVTPKDFGADGPLAGVEFQRRLEEKAYRLGGGLVPVERYGDFKREVYEKNGMQKRPDEDFHKKQEDNGQKDGISKVFEPQIKGKYVYAAVSEILPDEVNLAFIEGMEQFDKVIPGFADTDVFLEGVESRTSSPVRILRDETNQSAMRGLYPCGEGAGYAGGITSAAMDGMKIAEGIAREYKPLYTNAD